MKTPLRIFNPEGVFKPTAPYSQASKAGQFLFIAGQTPTDMDGRTVQGGIEAQTRQALSNLRKVLRSVGATPSDVVMTRIYLVDMSVREKVAEQRKMFFHEPYPPNTLIGVTALAQKDWLLEIEAIAVVDEEAD